MLDFGTTFVAATKMVNKSHMFENEEKLPNLILHALPVFLACILLELLVTAFIQKRKVFRFNDSFSSLSCGIVSRFHLVYFRLLGTVPYTWVYNHFNLYMIPLESWWSWLFCLIGVDLGYYVAHRASHRLNLFWAGHVTHHSSEEYNFTTALRQGFEGSLTWLFYLPLALFFPPKLYIVHNQINTIYQFFVHTKSINKLPWLIELIFNTPSHHRVHHARNPLYIDKNYAGMLIVWDRLFGTFVPEKEEPVYGITEPLRTWDPVFATYHHLGVHVVKKAWESETMSDKFKVLFYGPGYDLKSNKEYVAPSVDPKTVVKYDSRSPFGLKVYAFFQLMISLGATVAMMKYNNMPWIASTLITALVLSGLSCVGRLLDARPGNLRLELLRVVISQCVVGSVYLVFDFVPNTILFLYSLYSLICIIWLYSYRNKPGYSFEMLQGGQNGNVQDNSK